MRKSFATLSSKLVATNEAFEVKDREETDLSEMGALGATKDAIKLADSTAKVADGNTKVIEGIAEIDSLETGIEDALDGVKHIEALIKSAEEVTDKGGMTKSMAKLIETSHEAIVSRLGMSHRTTQYTKNPVPSFEAFDSVSSRKKAHLATMEDMKENIKKIIESIMKVLRGAWEKIQGVVANLLNNAALMEKHIDNLTRAVTAIPDTAKPQAATFDAFASELRVGGKTDAGTVMTLLASAKKLVTIIPESATALTVDAKALSSGKDPQKALAAELQKTAKKLGTGNAVGVYGHFVGGTSLKISSTEEALELEFVESAKPSQQTAAPNKAQMLQILKEAKEIVGMLKALQKPISTLKMVADDVQAAIKSYRSDDEAEKARIHAARGVSKFLTKVGVTYPGQVHRTVKASVSFVQAGLKNYQAPKAEAAPEGKKPEEGKPAAA